MFLAERRTMRRAALDLSVAASGARGDQKDVKAQIKKWTAD